MKFIYLAGVFALTLTFGCNNHPAEEQTRVIEKETVREVKVKEPTQPVKVEVEEEKGTSIKIGPDGGSVKTDKVDISVNH